MSKEAADKQKTAKGDKSGKQAQLGEPKKPKKPPKAAPEPVAEKEAPQEEKPKPAPRLPADPRLKFLKKFYGKFLPRGPLRDRHKALMVRWESGEDHGGVTADELKSLHDDWKAARAKPPRKVGVAV
jgi:hypothetical protein